MIQNAKKILKDVFGYDEFRPMQENVISNILLKRDTLAIMPTGSGKSLCYQIPALIFDGLTIIVSPLISLMQDQINQLNELGVNSVVLNSAISYSQYQDNILKIKNGKTKLLYAAPETLLKENILSLLKTVKVDCITIDEAHCISDWGHDFRPEYRMLVEVRSFFPDSVCIALTATATKRVQEDIIKTLNFKESNTFISSFNRDNLELRVVNKDDPLEQAIDFLKQFPNQSGIIYCFSRKQVDTLASDLEYNGYSVKPYHAGLSEKARKTNQELFIKDDIQIIVATIAFGMGINKPNVRFVLHYDLPKNIESYYQEIGRAGRDGLKSYCLLLFSYGDIGKIKYFINQKQEKEKRIANIQLNSLTALVTSQDCRRLPLLNYFGEKYEIENCNMCDNCLSEKQEKQDLTIPAQKLLSCIRRTGELYGLSHIIDILRGSNAKKILEKGHHKLSTHNIGRDFSKKQWMDLAQQLINFDYMKKDDNYGSLKFTTKSYEICNGKINFHGFLTQEKADSIVYEKTKIDYDLELFEILRVKRKELADKANIPPYIIFSDKALIEMAVFFPQNKDSFININGVGMVKMQKYGDQFIKIISDYALKNNIQEKQKNIVRKKIKRKENNAKKFILIGEKYNDGASLKQLSKHYKIKLSTVIDNLFQYVNSGREIRADGILESSLLKENDIEKVMNAFEKKGCELLKPVFNELKSKISYEELHLLRLYYIADSCLLQKE